MGDEQEWRAAWTDAFGNDRDAAGVLESLLARHREPHRHYHGVHHVLWVLRHVRALAAEHRPADLDALIVAACFHDAIYDPRRADNEALSADLAQRQLAELGWPADRCATVSAMVRATAGHVAGDRPDDGGEGGSRSDDGGDVAILLDADLAVLGADAAAYQAYATGVRAEYAHVHDEGWRTGRGEVLRTLLGRDPLYHTSSARAWWDGRARANLVAELASLG